MKIFTCEFMAESNTFATGVTDFAYQTQLRWLENEKVFTELNPTTQYNLFSACLVFIRLLYCATNPQKGGERCYPKTDSPSTFTTFPSLNWNGPILMI
jgi:hypothetical protein